MILKEELTFEPIENQVQAEIDFGRARYQRPVPVELKTENGDEVVLVGGHQLAEIDGVVYETTEPIILKHPWVDYGILRGVTLDGRTVVFIPGKLSIKLPPRMQNIEQE